MPLPPVKPPEKLLLEVYKDLLKGATCKFGDAFEVMADRILAGRWKSPEERALDWQIGAEESENRRRLAAEAIDRIPPERRIFPAPQIAGPIFRDSEFELPETPIWEMWSQLLSRACDSERVGEAHPAYATIIQQLSPDEAMLLVGLAPLAPAPFALPGPPPCLRSSEIGLRFPEQLILYLGHLFSLGLLEDPGTLDEGLDVVLIDGIPFRMLSTFGHGFISAVSEPSGAA